MSNGCHIIQEEIAMKTSPLLLLAALAASSAAAFAATQSQMTLSEPPPPPSMSAANSSIHVDAVQSYGGSLRPGPHNHRYRAAHGGAVTSGHHTVDTFGRG
jgi:hypothetical protein